MDKRINEIEDIEKNIKDEKKALKKAINSQRA